MSYPPEMRTPPSSSLSSLASAGNGSGGSVSKHAGMYGQTERRHGEPRTAEVAGEEGGARGDAHAVEGVVGEPVPQPREDEAEVLAFWGVVFSAYL